MRAAHQAGWIEGVVIRLSNSFGRPAHTGANCWMLLVNDLCRQAATTRKMMVHTSGRQRRDFITMTDACRALGHLLALPNQKLGNGLFNVGGAWSPTILEISGIVRECATIKLHAEVQISSRLDKEGMDAPLLDFRIDKIRETGFEPSRNQKTEVNLLLDFCISAFQRTNSCGHRQP